VVPYGVKVEGSGFNGLRFDRQAKSLDLVSTNRTSLLPAVLRARIGRQVASVTPWDGLSAYPVTSPGWQPGIRVSQAG
jgi:hypothetical protein